MYTLKYRAENLAKETDSTGTRRPISKPPAVIEIHDQAICERATRAYYINHLGPYPADGVAVVRFGDRYAVLGDIRGGEWTVLEVFNLKFEPIDGYWT